MKILTALTMVNVLNLLNVLKNVLKNVLNMPMDASLACWPVLGFVLTCVLTPFSSEPFPVTQYFSMEITQREFLSF